MWSKELTGTRSESTELQWLSLASVSFACVACTPNAQTTPGASEPEPIVEQATEASVGPGCHSGVRVGFVDAKDYPKIAACAGSWDAPGLVNTKATAGNAAAICAEGWHICSTIDEVKAATKGEGCAAAGLKGGAFFAIADGIYEPPACFTRGSIGVLGCGSLGAPAPEACAPLERVSNPGCSALEEPWACERSTEVWSLTKPKHEAGGVLCCEGKATDPTPATTPWNFAAGAPFGGSGQTRCSNLTLTSTNTEPWGDGMFRNSPNDDPSVVIVTFTGHAQSFHVSAKLSGRKAYIKGFNMPPSRVTGLAEFDGQRVQTPKGMDETTVLLSWVNTSSNALSWVMGGQDRHTVMLDGYRVDCE